MVWDGAVADRVAAMTGVIGRWRAADLGTDGGGPLANNAAVTSWTALVGNNASGSGTYIAASAINSRPAVRLNGSSNSYTATTSSRAQPVTLGVVFRTSASTEQQVYLTGTAQAFTNGGVWAVDLGSSTLAGGTRNTSPHVFTVVQSGASTTGRMDGTTILGPGNAGTAGLGSSLVWGQFFGGRWFTGDIAEVVVWNHALTTAELADWHSYVQDAYGVTVAGYVPPPVTSKSGEVAGIWGFAEEITGSRTPKGEVAGVWGFAEEITGSRTPKGEVAGVWGFAEIVTGQAPGSATIPPLHTPVTAAVAPHRGEAVLASRGAQARATLSTTGRSSSDLVPTAATAELHTT